MNNFATLKHIGTFKKVCFYSILIEGCSQTLYEEFYDMFKSDEAVKTDIQIIVAQIKEIGNRGAYARYFRHEGSAEALPQVIASPIKPKLRLYCIRLSDDAVVLLSGGIKTTQKAQDCPNVSNHFRLANKVSNQLTTAIKRGDIEVDIKTRPRLSVDIDFKIRL